MYWHNAVMLPLNMFSSFHWSLVSHPWFVWIFRPFLEKSMSLHIVVQDKYCWYLYTCWIRQSPVGNHPSPCPCSSFNYVIYQASMKYLHLLLMDLLPDPFLDLVWVRQQRKLSSEAGGNLLLHSKEVWLYL